MSTSTAIAPEKTQEAQPQPQPLKVAPVMKTYFLSEYMKPTAPIYAKANKNQRVRFDTIPLYRPSLQVTFQDKDGVSHTIRLKLNSNTPYQDGPLGQIEKEKILANEKFTIGERDAIKFRNAVLMTMNVAAQKFLEVHPENEAFDGFRPDEAPNATFKEYKKDESILIDNMEMKDRVSAAVKVMGFNLMEAQDMLIRIFGSFHRPPKTVEECQNDLIKYMDEDDNGYKEILKESDSTDDKTNILIGRAISAGIISFDQIPNQVSRKKGDTWIKIKEISSEHEPIERQRYFAEFLTSEDGKLALADLKKAVEATISKN